MPPSWVYAEARAGRLPHVRVGCDRRFRRCTVETWIEKHGRGRSDERLQEAPLRHRRPDYLIARQRDGLASKTVGNHLTFLHGVLSFAMKKGWAHADPFAAVDRPRKDHVDPDPKFLTQEEFEALPRAVGEDEFAQVDHPMLLLAATTGLRQGELVALCWRAVDWLADVVRVRRNYIRAPGVALSCCERGAVQAREDVGSVA